MEQNPQSKKGASKAPQNDASSQVSYTHGSSSSDGSSDESITEDDLVKYLTQGREFLNICGKYHERYLVKKQIHNRPTTGWELLLSTLNGADIRAYQLLRMNPATFFDFCGLLVNQYGLKRRRYVTVEEEVATFLQIVGTRTGNRSLQEYFQRGADTISKSFHNVLKACTRMSHDWVTPNQDYSQVHPYIRDNALYYPYFANCIGAIDGTHIKACVPEADKVRYIGRKGYATQNILVVCDFNMRFVLVMACYEGIVHDSRMLTECIGDESWNFPKPPPGKYYLVDSGFANTTGYMAPYRRNRYHIPDFHRARRGYNRKEELFNHRHSALRVVIERSIGVWKKRFHIVNDMPPNIKMHHQVALVGATMAIHNYLRHVNAEDDGSQLLDDINNSYDETAEENDEDDEPSTSLRDTGMEDLRQSICDNLWNAYRGRA